jgi:hypothetical protein
LGWWQNQILGGTSFRVGLSGEVNREMFENGVPLMVDADASAADAALDSVD